MLATDQVVLRFDRLRWIEIQRIYVCLQYLSLWTSMTFLFNFYQVFSLLQFAVLLCLRYWCGMRETKQGERDGLGLGWEIKQTVWYNSNKEKMNRKPGDWDCSSCQHLNFSRRDSCQRCGEARPAGSREERGEYSSFGRGGGGSNVRPGDWYCSNGSCNAHNFASRSSCFKCGAYKEDSTNSGGGYETSGGRASKGYGTRPGWKSGDWICGRSGCNEHNFASRMECFRCSAPREQGMQR